MKTRGGYTLLELIIASSLVTLVLAAMYSMVSSVVNFQTEAMRKSSVSGWNAVSMNMMTKEIEDATVIYYPDSSAPSLGNSNAVLGCSNWSTSQQGAATGGTMNAAANVTYFFYCLDTTTGPTAPSGTTIPVLRRIAATGTGVTCPAKATYSPTAPPVACSKTTVALTGSGINTNDIVASEVNVPASGFIFTAGVTAAQNSLNVNFVLGNESAESPGTATANAPTNAHIVNPQTSTVNVTIAVNRSYLDSKD
jgi:hypothetical protein